jgi:hypothetical protein
MRWRGSALCGPISSNPTSPSIPGGCSRSGAMVPGIRQRARHRSRSDVRRRIYRAFRRAQPGERNTSEGRGTGEARCRARCRQRRRSLPPCACAARSGDNQGARIQAERALAICPNLAAAHGALGVALAYSGRPDDGLAALKACIRFDPRDPSLVNRLNQVALAHYFCRDYEASVEAGRTGDPVVPRFSVALPLARRRPRRTRPDRGSQGGARKGSCDFAYLVRLLGPRTPALVSAAKARPHARRPQKSRMGGLRILAPAEPLPRPCQSAK